MRSLDSTGSMNQNQTHFRTISSGATVPLRMHIHRQKSSPQIPGSLKKEKKSSRTYLWLQNPIWKSPWKVFIYLLIYTMRRIQRYLFCLFLKLNECRTKVNNQYITQIDLIKKQAVSAADVAGHIRMRPNKAGMIKRALFISFVFSYRMSLPNFTDTAPKAK